MGENYVQKGSITLDPQVRLQVATSTAARVIPTGAKEHLPRRGLVMVTSQLYHHDFGESADS